ncbi:hypothetical protein R1sor_004443 [Riccia sorocarpa]|uniref:Uncharacterized protein n=1 Tax=Riccia sorocarpa TaxID=122646 RepID=A0ABD3HK79_9MARC
MSDLEKKEEELKNLRIRMEHDTSEETIQKVRELEEEVSRKENMEEREVEIDGSKKLKAKHQRESIKALQLEGGEVVTDDKRILEEIEAFYGELYKKDEEVEGAVVARARVMSYVKPRVTERQNHELVEAPSMEELEDIVKRLPEDKAPGLDGATVEVLTKCWSFMRADCLAMLLSYWQD